MKTIVEISYIVIPVFLVIGLGFSLKRTSLIDSDFLLKLNRLIYYVALPALLFYKIALADFSVSFNAKLILSLIAVTVIIFLVTLLFTKFSNYSAPQQGAFCQGCFRGNLGFIGLAIVYNAYGEEGLAIAGIVLGFVVPVLNFLSVTALLLPNQNQQKELGIKFWVSQIALNPLIIASFLGVIWSFFGIGLPGVIDKSFDIVTGMSLPLALLSIGASFSPKKLRGDIVKASIAVSFKIIWLPFLTGLVLYMVGVEGVELGVGVLLAGAPTATAAYIMAQQLKGDAELSSGIIMLSTLCSIFTYSISLYLLKVAGVS